MRYLIVVAHPDDEVLGAGGLIHSALKRGDSVRVVIMNSTDIESRPKMDSSLVRSHEIMGITDCIKFPYRNLHLSELISSMVLDIEHEIAVFRPDIIVTHYYGDIHPDHKAVFYATEQASRLFQRHPSGVPVTGLYCMDVPSSTNWGHSAFKPDTYFGFDEDDMNAKIEALRVYENVLREPPHPRSERAIVAHNVSVGSDTGFMYAEGFECVWQRIC